MVFPANEATPNALTMVYDSSSNTNDEIKIVHKLVSQVTRAFMDPPFVVIMERLMTGDM